MKKKESKIKALEEKIKLPEKLEVRIEDNVLFFKGPKGEANRHIKDKRILVSEKEGFLVLSAGKFSKTKKKVIKSCAAHIKNMMRGSLDGHTYTLKICSGHFPMTVAVANNEFVVKNFLGEKVPRKLILKKGAAVKVDGDRITVTSSNKEIAGQISADIEQLTRRTGYDSRIFQDGIYLINKDGKEIH